MNLGSIIEPIKRHPYIVVGGVVGVLVLIQLRGMAKGAAPAAQSGSGVYTMSTDPNALALQAQHDQNAADISKASIQAQTAQSYFDMTRIVSLAGIAAQDHAATLASGVSLAQVAASQQSANAAIGASMFDTAVQGVTANYISQLKANGASNIAYSSSTSIDSSSGKSGSGSGAAGSTGGSATGSNGSKWNVNLNSSGNFGTTTVNPAGSALLNTANIQIEQMFNNVLRAGAGQNVLETPIITDGGGTTQQTTTPPKTTPKPPTQSGGGGNGGSRGDPIFLNWINGLPLPTVTDITPTAGSAMGWVGSFINPNSGQSQAVH